MLGLRCEGSAGKGVKVRIEVMGQVWRAFMHNMFSSKIEPGERSEKTITSNIQLLSYLLCLPYALHAFRLFTCINSLDITTALTGRGLYY